MLPRTTDHAVATRVARQYVNAHMWQDRRYIYTRWWEYTYVHVGGGEFHDSQSFANGSAEVQVLESSALGQQLLLQLRAKPPLMRSCS